LKLEGDNCDGSNLVFKKSLKEALQSIELCMKPASAN